jgi:SAM-dependent methyltransferase
MCRPGRAHSVPRMTFDALTARQKQTWASGDYGAVAALIHPIAEDLVQAADLSAGARVLDVASGTGNAAIAAARCLCRVTATDYVPALLERAVQRAAAERLPLETAVADAQHLPYPDGHFDAVLSVVGAMFAPDQEQTAAELVRVCRPGGTVAMANWTPEGFIGEMFRTVGRRVPPPPGVRAPVEWGSTARLNELFKVNVQIIQRTFVFRFDGPAGFADYFKMHYGPTVKAFEALDDAGSKGLYEDLVALAERHNVATDGTARLPAAYVQVLVNR